MKLILLFFCLLSASCSFTQDLVTADNICYNAGDSLKIEFISIAFCIRPTPLSEFDYMDQAPLDSLIAILEANKGMSILIEVHSDTRGSADRNRGQTQGRADYFKRYLIHNEIESSRIQTIGYGEDKPVFEEKYIHSFRRTNKEKYEQLHQKNRRTLFIITRI